MSSFRFESVHFSLRDIQEWAEQDSQHTNWPVVYLLQNSSQVYVGETVHAAKRFQEHLRSGKATMQQAHVIFHDEFNKSACLNLESQLIALFSGDAGLRKVENLNLGQDRHEFYDKKRYEAYFDEIFEFLHLNGLLSQSAQSIRNGELFKYSPFKDLNGEQSDTVAAIVASLLRAQSVGDNSTYVVQGGMGTGKTIVGVFLAKLLSDISRSATANFESLFFDEVSESQFAPFFDPSQSINFEDCSIGLVIPQQALRKTVKGVVKRTSGLERVKVLTPFEVGLSAENFDLLIVDEAHRLNRRANQPSAFLNQQFPKINTVLFGSDDLSKTQLDWIMAKSRHQVFLIDPQQSVRTSDISFSDVQRLIESARDKGRAFTLRTQERVRNGENYVAFVRDVIAGKRPEPTKIDPDYFRIFDSLEEMRDAILEKNEMYGLSRLVAGYAWPWASKRDAAKYDIEIDGLSLRWNSASETDWLTSQKESAATEVGSIHTVQGYDLNYAGVIIGKDLQWDSNRRQMVFSAENYFDRSARQNNSQLGISFSEEDLLGYVQNIYSVLLTRGMRGTYVYICNPELKKWFEECLRVVS